MKGKMVSALLFFFILTAYLTIPVQAEYASPPNFHKVDNTLWRSGQPVGDQYKWLKDQGCKAIINLREGYNGDEALIKSLGMKYLYVPIKDDTPPTYQQMYTILDFIKTTHPALIHCAAGIGRTGTVVACYRISVYGWDAEKAINEAASYGLGGQSHIEFIRQWWRSWVTEPDPPPPVPLSLGFIIIVVAICLIAVTVIVNRKSLPFFKRDNRFWNIRFNDVPIPEA